MELALQADIGEPCDGDPSRLPDHIRLKISDRSATAARKNPTLDVFGQLAELRNGMRHSRAVDDVAQMDGEAAIACISKSLALLCETRAMTFCISASQWHGTGSAVQLPGRNQRREGDSNPRNPCGFNGFQV